jgi:hypothetical protein
LPWRVPASRYVPSQRFARSQGLAPPGTCRPCFMPVPPLGFCPSGSVSTRRAVHPLGCLCPPGVGGSSWLRLDCLDFLLVLGNLVVVATVFSRRRRFRRPAPLQGVAPCECPHLRADCLEQPDDGDPHGLCPP